jgi:hypothetical protein
MGQIQTTFPTQTRLADTTGLPVLGSISEIFTREGRAKHRQRLVWLTGGAGALGGAWALLLAVEFWQRSTVA